MTKNKRVELYRRLPEIYRIKDEDLPKLYLQDGNPVPAMQLRKYLEPVEDMFSAIHENIESLYHDFFIETCDPWVIPYIADLLGTSHIAGEEWTRRADVADTIALRRRKGTLGAVELLTFILTRWGVHSVELMEKMVWNQHLNHQRPDEGGTPPYSLPKITPATPRRGGTVSLRDPSLLAQIDTPFDPFAHVADVKPFEVGEQARYNLPNLAIYLWRLKDYRLDVTKPHALKVPDANPGDPFIVRVNVDPIPPNDLSNPYVNAANLPAGRPVKLFNTNRTELFAKENQKENGLNISAIKPRIAGPDRVPAPIPRERISDYEIADKYDETFDPTKHPAPLPLKVFTDASFTAPQEYLKIETYNPSFSGTKDDPVTPDDPDLLEISDVGLQLHLPSEFFPGSLWPHTSLPRHWKIRGASLTAWERGVNPPLEVNEVAIDPVIGRIAMCVADETRADALIKDLLVTYTYGAVGPVGAHPVSYPPLEDEYDPDKTAGVSYFKVDFKTDPQGLQKAFIGIAARTGPTVIEIVDSRTHQLDTTALPAADRIAEGGVTSIKLNAPLIIRAADNQRPVVELLQPLAFRPVKVFDADPDEQKKLDAKIEHLFVRLEGLFVARGQNFASGLPLIARATIGRLDIISSTLDPGGFRKYFCDPATARAPRLPGINLKEPYGFSAAQDEVAFKQTPEINIQRSICGAVFTDEGYRLCIEDSIIESIPVTIAGVSQNFAIANAIDDPTDPAADIDSKYAGAAVIRNVTILGRVRAYSIEGSGGIFTGIVEALDRNAGCLKYCFFPEGQSAATLPQNYACVDGKDAKLIFTSDYFGQPGYCQLSLECDRRILEEGNGSDQMGAFNFLQEAHKWRNLQIRFREFMPVGIRPLLIPVT